MSNETESLTFTLHEKMVPRPYVKFSDLALEMGYGFTADGRFSPGPCIICGAPHGSCGDDIAAAESIKYGGTNNGSAPNPQQDDYQPVPGNPAGVL